MIDPALANGPHDHDHLEPKPPLAEMSDDELRGLIQAAILPSSNGHRGCPDAIQAAMDAEHEVFRRFEQYRAIVERLPKDEDGNPQIEGWIADRHGPVRVHLTLTNVEKDNPRNMLRVPYATSWTLHPTAEAALAATNQPAADQKGNNDE